jgi:asparagine synthase (glutamine-hydrolysing)
MSGIFGMVYEDQNSERPGPLLEAMGRAMSHLPWHRSESTAFAGTGAGLGRVLTGLVNPEPQPVFSEDHQVALVMAGEFYHQGALRLELAGKGILLQDGGDAGLALQLYLERGPSFVAAVEGLFAIAIWDRQCGCLYLLNDRFGFSPLYYARQNGAFLFSSEMKGILAEAGFPRRLNWTAVAEMLRFQQLLGEKTFFEDITLLPPAAVLRVDCSSLQIYRRTYWDWRSLRIGATRPIDDREVFEESERLLRRSVEARLERAARPGIYLSGGLDSRALLAMAAVPTPKLCQSEVQLWLRRWLRETRPRDRRVRTLTYGRRESRDAHLAQRIARLAGMEHTLLELPDGGWVKEVVDLHLELVEGTHNWVHVHGLSFLPEVRDLIDVNLFGTGGGMVMSTAFVEPGIVGAPDEEAFLQGMFQLYTQKHAWPGLTSAEEQRLYSERLRGQMTGLALESLRLELAGFEHADFRLRNLFFNILNHDRSLVFNHVGMSSAFIDGRLPFYDYRLVDWLAALPLELKADKRIHKELLRRSLPGLAWIPYDKDNRLPTRNPALRRMHAGYLRLLKLLGSYSRPTLYADYENYLRGELRDWAESLLFDERTLARGLFRPEAVRSLFDRHLSGHELWTIGKIAPLITLEMLLRRFFDEASDPSPARSDLLLARMVNG